MIGNLELARVYQEERRREAERQRLVAAARRARRSSRPTPRVVATWGPLVLAWRTA